MSSNPSPRPVASALLLTGVAAMTSVLLGAQRGRRATGGAGPAGPPSASSRRICRTHRGSSTS